jgi:hypothetical protein
MPSSRLSFAGRGGRKAGARIAAKLARAIPDSIVFWLGTGPPGGPGHPVCDHLHLFPSPAHLKAWLEEQPDELGLEVSLADLVNQVSSD